MVSTKDYIQLCALIVFRLQEETARVEKCLLDGHFTEAIVKCFNTPKANNFDYNLLEPLQKLLRLSPPVAASLARFDMYSGILQKLNHKKAVIRLNLLRIARSICEPNEECEQDIRSHHLFEAIEGLADHDGAVLVRNMASELVRSTFETTGVREQDVHSSASKSRRNVRRQSSFPTPSQRLASPTTPTHGGRANISFGTLMDSFNSPRRPGPAAEGRSRPTSRDGSQMLSKMGSSESVAGTPVIKSRLPRTSAALRTSRASLAGPIPRDSRVEPTLSPRKRGDSGGSMTSSSSGGRVRSDPKQPSASMSHLVSKRRPRAPSGDIKWS